MRVEGRDGKVLTDSHEQEEEDSKTRSDLRIEDVSRISGEGPCHSLTVFRGFNLDTNLNASA